jgi:hypothetical protein
MRIIIIIQTLIILAGAYYLYSQSQQPEVEVSPVLTATTTTPFLEGYTPPTENPPSFEDVATTSDMSDITGHNDVGMEYPIPDNELEVR